MKRYIALFLAGLICIGVGAAVMATEFLSMELVQYSSPTATKEQLVTFAEGTSVMTFDFPYYIGLRVEADDTLSERQARVVVDYDSRRFTGVEIYPNLHENQITMRRMFNERYFYDQFKTALSEMKHKRLLIGFGDNERLEVVIYVHPSMQHKVVLE